MATKLYLHAATSPTYGGTLPAATQSGLTISKNVDAQTVNRYMTTKIGTSQTSLALSSTGSTSTLSYYFSRFVSPPLESAVTISAQTWTLQFGEKESNASANFPVTTSGTGPVCCYVWRPSTNTKVGNILISASGLTSLTEATTSQGQESPTFSGASVVCNAGDVICVEIVFTVTQGSTTSYTDTFYYDGTTESSSSNEAAYLLAGTDTLNFQYPQSIADNAITVSDAVKRHPVGRALADHPSYSDSLTTAKHHIYKYSPADTATISEHLSVTRYVVTIDAIVATKIPSTGQHYKIYPTDTITYSDAAPKRMISRKLVDICATSIDTIKRLIGRKLPTDAITYGADAILKYHRFIRSWTDALVYGTDAIKRLVGRKLTDAPSISDSIVKNHRFIRSITDALTMGADAIRRGPRRALADSITVAADAITKHRRYLRGMTDTTTVSADSIKRLIGRALADASSITDAIVKHHRYLRALADSVVVGADAIKRLVGRKLADTISLSDVIAKSRHQFRTITDALSYGADSLKKLVYHKVSDSLAYTDSRVRQVRPKLTTEALVYGADALKKKVWHFWTDALGAVTETFAATKPAHAPKTPMQGTTEALGALGEAIKKLAYHKIADAPAYTDSPKKLAVHKLADAPSFSDSLSGRSRHQFRTVTDAITYGADSVKKTARKFMTDSLGSVTDVLTRVARHYRTVTDADSVPTDNVKKVAIHRVSDSVNRSDAITKKAYKSISDGLGLVSESLKRSRIQFRSATDALGAVGESIKKKVWHYRTDALAYTDALSIRSRHQFRTASDSIISGADSIKKKVWHSMTDALGAVTEVLARSRHQFKTMTDSLGSVTDAVKRKIGRKLSDALGAVTEAISATGIRAHTKMFIENLGLVGESIAWQRTAQAILDSVNKKVSKYILEPITSGADAVIKARKIPRSFTESIAYSDIIKLPIFFVAFFEALGLGEAIKKKAVPKTAAEPVTETESFVKVKRLTRARTDALGSPSDSVKKLAVKSIYEFLAISEVVTKKAWHKMADVSSIGESITKLAIHYKADILGTVSDAVKKKAIKTISDPIMSQDVLTKKAWRRWTDALGAVTDVIHSLKSNPYKFFETINVGADQVKSMRARRFSEIVIAAEVIKKKAWRYLYVEAITYADISKKTKTQFRYAVDSLGLVTDRAGHFHRYFFSFAEKLGGIPGIRRIIRHHLGGRRPDVETQPE